MTNVHHLVIPRVTPPSGDPFLDVVEAQIIRNLASVVEEHDPMLLDQAIGLALARTMYLRSQERPEDEILHYGRFIADAMTVLRKMSARQRNKLRHPSCSREEMQRLLEGDQL